MEHTEATKSLVRVIVTTCGRELRRDINPMTELRRKRMRNAMIGCGTDDECGLYVDIADVYFLEQSVKSL
jgi:hypothetical protein